MLIQKSLSGYGRFPDTDISQSLPGYGQFTTVKLGSERQAVPACFRKLLGSNRTNISETRVTICDPNQAMRDSLWSILKLKLATSAAAGRFMSEFWRYRTTETTALGAP
jgi:hypothetical protein